MVIKSNKAVSSNNFNVIEDKTTLQSRKVWDLERVPKIVNVNSNGEFPPKLDLPKNNTIYPTDYIFVDEETGVTKRRHVTKIDNKLYLLDLTEVKTNNEQLIGDSNNQQQNAPATGNMYRSNNLSDLASASTSRTNLGIGNIDNTSDLNKPISTATQTALNAKTAVRGIITLPYGFIAAPADSTTYYHGFPGTAGLTTFETVVRVYIPRACYIKAVTLYAYKGAGSGSNENISVYIRVNATTDTAITTTWQWTTAFGFDTVANTGLNIALATGDFFTLKFVTPAWATNPANVYVNCSIEVEET